MPMNETAPINSIERQLSGGHPNSLGNTVAVVEAVLADHDRLDELFSCYGSTDPVVRLRVSSALKRVSAERPEWLVPHLDELLTTVAALDQASAQWTLAILFDRLRERMSPPQRSASIEVMQRNLDSSDDWIVQNTTMQVLADWSVENEALARWLEPRLVRLSSSPRKSVSARARKLSQRAGASTSSATGVGPATRVGPATGVGPATRVGPVTSGQRAAEPSV